MKVIENDKFPEGFVEMVKKLGVESKVDHFGLLLHSWMLDIGFILDKDQPQSLGLLTGKLENSTSSAGLKFYYMILNSDDKSKGSCFLQIIPIGQSVVLKGFYASEPTACFSMSKASVALSEYIVGDVKDALATRFIHVNQLAQEFKNEIALPLLRHAKNALGIPPGTESIDCLPPELIPMIAARITSPLSLLNFGATCKSYSHFSNTPTFWKTFFKRDFSNEYASLSNEEKENPEFDWKDQYKQHKLREKLRLRVSSTSSTGWPRNPEPQSRPPPRPSSERNSIPPRFRPRYDPPFPDPDFM